MSSNPLSGAPNYKLQIKDSAAKELESVGTKKDRKRIASRIQALATDPRPPGSEKLAGEENKYRIRQGNYRVVYSVDDRRRTVLIVRIGNRKEVYR
ncbi:MAG TPA: type II toxin-antitoxin system RelE/ParE family toxin [Terriglobia bacterium]|nr:type II toxin-antitoxin system RelE/ParE family toxin [Terriglobia bacterium]